MKWRVHEKSFTVPMLVVIMISHCGLRQVLRIYVPKKSKNSVSFAEKFEETAICFHLKRLE